MRNDGITPPLKFGCLNTALSLIAPPDKSETEPPDKSETETEAAEDSETEAMPPPKQRKLQTQVSIASSDVEIIEPEIKHVSLAELQDLTTDFFEDIHMPEAPSVVANAGNDESVVVPISNVPDAEAVGVIPEMPVAPSIEAVGVAPEKSDAPNIEAVAVAPLAEKSDTPAMAAGQETKPADNTLETEVDDISIFFF
jgi:hypothetical protein